MEALIIFLIFNILILFWAYYYKYRTKWNIIVQTFPVLSEPNGEYHIGTHSAFQSSISKYPIVDTVTKFILCNEGLYVKYELFVKWLHVYS